jgi:hypothetical protein
MSIKKFSLKQLFAIVDGRMSTSMDDIYDILNHVCDTDLMTHHLPVAKNYVLSKNPSWVNDVSTLLKDIYNSCPIKERNKDQFLWCMDNIGHQYFDIPKLKSEFDTSDFNDYMVNNSLLNR